MIVEVRRPEHVQRLSLEDFEQRVRDGELAPDTEVRFEVITGDRFVPASSLELFQSLTDPRLRAFRQALGTTGLPIVTALLVGVQIRIYAWSWSPAVSAWAADHATNWAPAILEQGEAWRLLSYGFLHLSFTHLLFNLCFLAYTGYHLERALGRAQLVLLYVASVVFGGLLSMSMAPDRPSLGASGGDFGLLAASVVLGWKHWDALPVRARRYFGWALAPYLGFSIISGLQSEQVDNWSHLGGLLAGGLLATVLDPPLLARDPSANRRTTAILALVTALTMGGVAAAGTRLLPLDTTAEAGFTSAHPSPWKSGWTFTGDRGWFSPTLQATLSSTTTVHPEPLSAADAADLLLSRVRSGSRAPEVLARGADTLGGLPAERLHLRFVLADSPQEMVAWVATRGNTEHRVVFQANADAAGRYAPLLSRVQARTAVSDPPELTEAASAAALNPRSWGPAVAHAQALGRIGRAADADAELLRARSLAPQRPEPLAALLTLRAEHGLPGATALAAEALAQPEAAPSVIVAACLALRRAGQDAAADAALDAAWARLPGDRTLARARAAAGLPTSLPTTDSSPSPP